MNFVMFCLGAFSLAVGLVAMPYVSMLRNAIKSRIRRGKNTQPMAIKTNEIEIGVLKQKVNELEEVGKKMVYKQMKHVNQIDDLETQVDNLAERLATRERNRKNNLRRDIREYLEELKNG